MTPLEVAKKFLNQSELPGNKFKDDLSIKGDLGELLKKAGHKDGEAWCCYFMEAVFCEAYPDREKQLRGLFSANCVQTYRNMVAAGFTVSEQPVVGALVIFQQIKNGVRLTTGHAAICEKRLTPPLFCTIEGNTTKTGSREGTTVMPKCGRTTAKQMNGLEVLGFIVI